MQAAVERREFSARLSQRCTCVVETESDSEAESEHGLLPDGAASSPMTRPRRRSGSGASSSSTHSRSSSPSPPAVTVWAKSLSLLELARSTSSSSVRDPIKTSQALHNSEALRMAQALPNVFCACYDAETVLSTIQRRERGFSPVQRLLLEPESIAKVFEFATSVPRRSRRQESSASATSTASDEDLRERYHRPFLAMEIVLRFYLKAMAWHGEPGVQIDGQDEDAAEVDIDDVNDDDGEENAMDHQEGEQSKLQNASHMGNAAASELVVAKASTQQLASTLNYTGGFRRHASATRKNFRMHVSMRLESSSGSFSDDCMDGEDDGRNNSAARGFILRLEELSSTQWKRIFAGLYQILWGPSPAVKSDDGKPNAKVPSSLILGLLKPHAEEDEPTIDSILTAYMCRITKNLIVFPSVHRMICEIEVPVESSRRKETVLERLAFHAYNPEIASLLHGMIHLAHRRQLPIERGVKCIVRRAIDRMPTRPARTLSTASSTSTSSSTSSLSPTSALSPSSILNGFSASSSTSQSVFSSRRPIAHERITGCVGILTKILSQEFPNTFRYYIQTRVQLASFENVEAFERELFPPKLLPNDPSIHEGIKNAVLDALLDNPDVITRLAELGTAELRFLEANQANGVGTPTNLVVDALRLVIECSLNDPQRLDQLVVPIQSILESVCASINYHQHLSTISEFASRDCFSDSDSDESADEDVSDASSTSIGDDTDEQVAARVFGTRDGSVMSFRVSSPVMNASKPSKTIISNRPLTSPLLVVHVIELLDAIIRMSRDTVDTRLTRFDLARSLLDIFEKFPKANILHCRLLKLYLNLLDRETSNERVNNPLLRSVFRPPESVLAFIMHKLHKSGASHQYDAHLAILGVKIDKISSAPTLQQELVRQYCHNTTGWADFASSLVASHYQQMDALDESLFGLSASDEGGGLNGHTGTRSRGSSGDGMEDMIPLSRPSSSASEYLSRELIPFRRLPVEKEGFGSAQNLASGNEAVHPTDMFRSRTQSRYSESIIDILRSDTTTSFDAVEDELEISGCAYQKRANWARVSLKFDKHTCELTIQDVAPTTVTSPPNVNGGLSSPSSKAKALASTSTSKLKQFLLSRKQYWNSRPKKLVVCNARKWIAFGRSIKNPSVGAFGFQVEVFDGHREVDETLTFVTRSETTRTRWFEAMQDAVAASRSGRNSLTDVDEAANITLVECVATNRMGLTSRRYLAVPDVNLLSPLIPSNFILKSDVPEEVPFWGSFHGAYGVSKYVSLFNRCLRVASVEEKRMHASGYSVIVEFDATFQAADTNLGGGNGTPANIKSDATPRHRASVRCSCTDTYLISGNQIIGLTRTIADSEKLLQLLHEDA
jgi:hypothetical protein